MSRPFLEDIVKRKPTNRARPVAEKFPPAKIKVGNRPRYMLWSVAALSVAFLLLALSFFFAQAEVQVYPKIEQIRLEENFSANKEASGNGLAFDLVVLSGEKTKTLAATEVKEVAEKATGTVTIFNSYSSAPQRLNVDTRLSGSNGKLYKTEKKIVVPGMRPDGVPGSVEVGIYAAEAGEAFNSEPLDFQIVGFQGTPKYEKFKVRSKAGTEISGGFQGKTLVVSEADQTAAREALAINLRKELFQKATDQIPEGFILFPGGAAFVVDKVIMPLSDTELTVTLRGTLYGLLLEEEGLTQKIAEKKVSGYDGEAVYIPNLHALKFILGNVGDVSLAEMNNISFNLSGPTQVVWKLDEEKFTAELLGRSKKDFSKILFRYANINRAELTLFPFWLRSIPDQPEKVKVRVQYPATE